MTSVYTWTTLPWAVILSALGGFWAWRAARRGDRAATLRRIGWALVPWALWFVGLMTLVVRIGNAMASWAAGFVFRPSAWAGLVIAVVAVALIAGGGLASRRSTGRSDDAVTSRRATLPGRGKAAARDRVAPAVDKKKAPAVGDDDMADIEAILRKHGIS